MIRDRSIVKSVSALAITSLVLTVVIIQPLRAHSPYFSQIEKITLPDGSVGELRLLHGDGIFLPDPVRILVLDSSNRVIARSHIDVMFHLLCKLRATCVILNSSDKLLQLDPSTFRTGDIISDEQGTSRGSLFFHFDGPDENAGWGFRVRSPNLGERMEIYWSLLKDRWQLFSVATLIAMPAGVAIFARRRSPGPDNTFQSVFWFVTRLVVFSLYAFGSLVVTSFYLTDTLAFIALALGIVLTGAIAFAIRSHSTKRELLASQEHT